MEKTIEEVDYLARSTTRVRLLEALYENGSLEKAELKDRVDVSRTTIQRNLDALEAEGWVRDDNCEYWITRSGELVAEQLLALLDTIYVSKQFEPLLKWLPPDSFDLDVHSLADADLVVADERDPYAPVNRHLELMQSAETFRGLLPAVGLQPLLVAHECVTERGHTQEIVVDEDVAATLSDEPNYRDPVEALLESDRCAVLVADRTVPFYLGLADDTVQIGVGDDDEVPRSLAETSDPDVRDWVERTYEEFRADAEPLAARWTGSMTA